uniref:Fido domain-containing protein n=1 Tax=Globodera rostochiensis TaxID=31243 RepID=A0A914IE16_GLORO
MYFSVPVTEDGAEEDMTARMLVKKLGLEVKKEVEEKDAITLESCGRCFYPPQRRTRPACCRGCPPTYDVSVGDVFDPMDWDETILQLHKSILGRHVGAGVLRTHDVSVGDDFDVMDWDEVPAEMDKFVSWLDAEMKAGAMSAAEFAAHASHRFLFIHPFCDGNGRTSRLIINMIMERRGFEPLILPEETRDEYYDVLKEASDKKDLVPYIKFISFHQQCCQ